MKLFECQVCGQLINFENTHCERCGHNLGYLSALTTLTALTKADGENWQAIADKGASYRFCANAKYGACNWLVAAGSIETYCVACRLNRTVPDLEVDRNLSLWRQIEVAKRRLIYGLLRFRLPFRDKQNHPDTGLAFDFLAGSPYTGEANSQVVTGHQAGLITLDIAEADDAERERRRSHLAEPFRTLLGHLRHEVGHYYWERLVKDSPGLSAYRALFGDERADYGAALDAHYTNGPARDWQQIHVSSYASAHPWEDFAETWAHYLHMIDTLETARAFGIHVRPDPGGFQTTMISFDPYDEDDFDQVIAAWLPLTYAVNSLNRSMGQPDLYPFLLAPAVIDKLRFVHDLIDAHKRDGAGPTS